MFLFETITTLLTELFFATQLVRKFNITTPDSIYSDIQEMLPHFCSRADSKILPFMQPRMSLQTYNQTTMVISNLTESYVQGAFLTGFLTSKDSDFSFELLDPRGANPPFGKGTKIEMSRFELVLFWAAQPYFIPPHQTEVTVWKVEIGFFGLEEKKRLELVDFEEDFFAVEKFCW